MLKLIELYGLCLLLIAVGVICWTNYTHYQLLLGRTSLEIVYRQLKASMKEVRICIMGDSIPAMSLDPRMIEGAFNFACRGENYIQTFFKFQWMIKQGAKLDAVILPIDIHSFSRGKWGMLNLDAWHWRRFVNYWALAWELKSWDLIWIRLKGFIYPLSMRPGIGVFWVAFPEVIQKGFMTEVECKDLSTRSEAGKIKSAANSLAWLKNHDYLLHPPLVRYFTKLLQLAQDNHITPVLVRFPLSRTYREQSLAVLGVEKLDAEIDELTRQFPHVQVLDYLDFFEDESYFHDVRHINTRGTAVLTEKMIQDLEKAGILRAPERV